MIVAGRRLFLRNLSGASARADSVRPASAQILQPYTGDPQGRQHRRRRAFLLGSLIISCLILGGAFALLAPSLIAPVLALPAILALITIWALPDVARPQHRVQEGFFFAFFITTIMWPNYLAIAIPGLPWITVSRLIGLPLMTFLLISVSTSKPFRERLAQVLAAAPWLWRLIVIFVAIQLLSILFSADKSQSIQKFIVTQFSWTAIFFVGCWVFSKPGAANFWVKILWAMAVTICLLTIVEFRLGRLPWAGHIPSFLQINDPSVAGALATQTRAYSGRYRAHATFGTSLGLGEFLALSLPFILNILATTTRTLERAAAGATIILLFVASYLSNARSGTLGLIIGTMLYFLFWAIIRWRRSPRGILGPAIVVGYPVMGLIVLAITLFVGKIHRAVWGGGETAASTGARVIQYRMGWPLILSHPWGYGIGQGAPTLNFHVPSGELTIDTYYLAVALEYGIVGFFVYYGLFIAAIVMAIRTGLNGRARDSESKLLIPLAVATVVFIFIKSVFSQQDNHPLVFMMLGMVAALVWRVRNYNADSVDLTQKK
jgi:hypothetical protein